MKPTNEHEATLAKALADADALRRQGDLSGARCAVEDLVDSYPDAPAAVYALARIAAAEKKLDDCIALLERAVELAPENLEYLARLAAAFERTRDVDGALDTYAAVLEIEPENVPALMRTGALYAAKHDLDAAARAYQRVVLLRGPAAPALRNKNLPDGLRRQLQLMHDTLSARYRALFDETWQYLTNRYAAADLERIRLAFSMPLAERHRRYAHPAQRPEFLMFPGLAPRGWFEREELPWVPAVESASETVLAEYLALREHDGAFEPYIKGGAGSSAMTPLGTDFSSLADQPSWRSFHLNKAGRIDAHCARCPQTAALMEAMPLAQADDYMPEIFFSVLAPGAHIVPHYGQMNVRLTVHLGLIVPDDCAIRVGDETRTWQPGRVLAFDDSFEHEAFNRADTDRVVLIFEVWHPDLAEAEIDGLQHFFRTRSRWLRQFAAGAPVSKHG